MSDKMPSRGFQGAVLKLFRAGDYQLTVTGRREVTPHYLRLSFDGGGLLTDRPLHPTMWIRMWFADGDKQHQRGYTLVDPNPVDDTVDIEFALHDGVASRWAQDAQPGDTIEVTVLGSNFTLPEPPPGLCHRRRHRLAARDQLTADRNRRHPGPGLPGGRPRRRQATAGGASADVVWVDRKNGGEALVEAVSSSAFDAADHFGWVACDNRTTREVAKVFREDYKIPRKSIKAQAYWVA